MPCPSVPFWRVMAMPLLGLFFVEDSKSLQSYKKKSFHNS